MARHVYVKEIEDSHPHREAEIQPFPIGEAPAAPDRQAVEAAGRILAPAAATLEFKAGPHAAPVARVARFESFVEALRDVPTDALEHTLYSGALEGWIGDVLGDADFRREVAGIRALARHGEPLRTVLYTAAKSRFDELVNL